MRWSLRNQIIVPLLLLMMVTLSAVTAANIYLAVRRTKGQLATRLEDVANTLAASSFPLTSNVLRQMSGLSGAEFLVVDAASTPVATSFVDEYRPRTTPADADLSPGKPPAITFGQTLSIAGVEYFHSQLPLERRSEPPLRLHVYFPEQTLRDARRDAAIPPLVLAVIALTLTLVLGWAISARVAAPVQKLQVQVARVAQGDFQPMPLPGRNDELLDLAQAVNSMAEMLSNYESQVRRHEQVRTLAQLSGGLAHQIRNSITGCRLALELHQRGCTAGDQESLQVASRQLVLMEEYVRRVLTLGRCEPRRDLWELGELLGEAVRLVEPAARHAGVLLTWLPADRPCVMRGDRIALQQVLINLLTNGIEAAARRDVALPNSHRPAERVTRFVAVSLASDDANGTHVLVRDNGPGPSNSLADNIFEPFVTDKPSGLGLGLAVAREIVRQHQGQIRWWRDEEVTVFSLTLPFHSEEPNCVEAIGR